MTKRNFKQELYYSYAELQEKVNNEEWTKFALWLKKIRDE